MLKSYKKLFFLILMVVLMGGIGECANWIKMGAFDYVEADTVEYDAKTRTAKAWLQRFNDGDIPKIDNKKVEFLIYQTEFDCKSSKIRTVAANYYDKNSKIIVADDVVGPWKNAVPNTHGGDLLQTFCGHFESGK